LQTRNESDLDRLIESARKATGMARSAFRHPIAGHGLAALERVSPWMTDAEVEPRLRWFAVRVVTEIGAGYRDEAIDALRRAQKNAPDEETRRDAMSGLADLAAPRLPRARASRAKPKA
jgi:hypothetical protein